jgi:hypothetical protein
VGEPDVVVSGTPEEIYFMFVERRVDAVEVEGDRRLLEQLINVAPQTLDSPIPA